VRFVPGEPGFRSLLTEGTDVQKQRLLVFIVAYYAEATIEDVLRRIPAALTDDYDIEILIIDDSSQDETFASALRSNHAAPLPFQLTVLYNPVNQGYGGNQKIGYHYAIERGFDYVALLHGDGQYAPERLPELMRALHESEADAVFGSRMLTPGGARKGGMPGYKLIGNRILTGIQNRLLGTALSEFHSGYRVFSTRALTRIPFERNTNDFHFDTEIIIQLVIAGQKIVEHPIPTHYGDEVCRVDGLRYAKDVVKASVQAALQKFNLFYDRRFDCAPAEAGSRYPSKMAFDSTHTRVCELVPEGARVLDLGCGSGAVGAALCERKNCRVVGVDAEPAELTRCYEAFISADLNRGIPDLGEREFDYVLALDVIEHLDDPETFLDQLREKTAAWPRCTVVMTTGNVGFLLMRLSLALGRFEYGRRGILDLTHRRLFTFNTLRRAMRSAGFVIERVEGVVPPLPFIFGSSRFSTVLMAVARLSVRIWPRLFAFQCVIVARPRPTLQTLLASAHAAAADKVARAA
jgi:glycosyltransferase involved in cell wall biosynthesis/SAM-dependent methyltransferase